MKIVDVSSIQNIPGYVEILKFVLKTQIQNLVEQLQDHAGEETLVLSANLTAGTLSHLESDRGQGFLDNREDIKSQFLTHCLQGKQKYHTAEPPGSRPQVPSQHNNNKLTKPGITGLPHDSYNKLSHPENTGVPKTDTSECKEPGTNRSVKHSSAELIHTGTSKLIDAGSAGLSEIRNSKSNECSTDGLLHTSRNINISTESNNVSFMETSNKLIKEGCATFPQSSTPLLAQTGSKGCHLNMNGARLEDAGKLSVLGKNRMSEVTFANTYTVQVPDKVKTAHIPTCTHQNGNTGNGVNQNCTKAPVVSGHSPGLLNTLPAISQSMTGNIPNLPTINHSVVKDLMSFSFNTHGLPEYMQSLQSNITPVKIIDSDQNNTNMKKLAQVSSVLYPDSLSNLMRSENNSPAKRKPVTKTTYSSNMVNYKGTTCKSLAQENTYSATKTSLEDILLQRDADTPAKEQLNKTTKRKQKRNADPKLQSRISSMFESPVKKSRQTEPGFSQSHTPTADIFNTFTAPVYSKAETISSIAPVFTNISTPSVANTASFSLLKMQPVVLIDDPNQGARKVFIESGPVNQTMNCSKSPFENSKSLLVEQNVHLANTQSSANKQTHAIDVKEKDKTKKTLSSKIDEITQRITKDDAIKQHTVQTSDCDDSADITACPVSCRSTSTGNIEGLNTETSNHGVSTPPSVEHLNDGDPSKLKDGSRASHRKPKLPRFNIGVASDDEDNAESVESPDMFSAETSTHQTASVNPFGTPQSSVNLSTDDAQDIINIQVSGEDSETSFPHLNLEELADGLLLTDIPIVSYYNSVDDSSKSLIESVFNLKPGRDPSTKKPLNSQSVIVSGSKLEKDWVKCPLCPDKFLTVEALQYHIKNVNHVAKKYECDLCKRKFSQLRDMERHRRIHTGERPFTCDVCNKSFSRKDNLKSHARKH